MDYEFRPLGKKCAGTGLDLVPGTACHSVLVEKEGTFERLDFSEAGWKGDPAGAIGSWKCLVPFPAETRKHTLDTPALFQHFEELQERGQPDEEPLRYILALLLMQKRRLKLDGSRSDGSGDYLQFSDAQGAGNFEVRDLHLSDTEMETLQQTLNSHLAAELA